MRTKSCFTAVRTFAICTLLSSPAFSPAFAAPADVPVRLAGAQTPPAQVYGKLFSGQQEEVVAAAEAMPADKYNFAPTNGTFQGVRTFAQQVTHIASSQYYFFTGFGLKPSVDSDAIDKLTSKDEIVKALKDSYALDDVRGDIHPGRVAGVAAAQGLDVPGEDLGDAPAG